MMSCPETMHAPGHCVATLRHAEEKCTRKRSSLPYSAAPGWVNNATQWLTPRSDCNRTQLAWTFKRAVDSNLCIVVLGFDRIHYLTRVLDALLTNNLTHTSQYVVLDGAINAFSGRAVARPHDIDAAATEVVRRFARLPSPLASPFYQEPVLHRYTMNVGIGIAWFEIFDAALAHHPTAIFLEDDVVPSPHAVVVFRSLLQRYQADVSVSGVTGAYQTHQPCINSDGRKLDQDVAVDRWTLSHDWAFAHWRDRWLRARPTMLKYMAIIDGHDYGRAPAKEVMTWHRHIGSNGSVHSQDQARRAAFRASGYCGMVRTRARRILPIGRRGTHMSDANFQRMGLFDEGIDYIRAADRFTADEPDRWEECPLHLPASNMAAVQTVVDGQCKTCGEAAERAAHQRSPPKSDSHAQNVDKLGIDLPSPDWTNGGRASLGGSTFGLAKSRNMASWRARVAEYQQNRSMICSGSSDCEAFDAIEHFFWGMEGGISLELGGLDGVFSSETLMLEKLLNFKRIVVEANPAMRKRRQDQAPQVLGANIAVCGSRGKVHYLQGPSPEGLVNGIAEFMPQQFLRRYYPHLAQAYAKVQSWDAVRTVRKEFMRSITKVECMPLSYFFRIFRIARIDFMILDVEGAELSVLRTIDWSAVTVNVLVIESIASSRPAEYRHEVDRYILNASNTYPRTFTKVFDARGRNCWYRDKTFSPNAVIASILPTEAQ